jgi:hypothetical protein
MVGIMIMLTVTNFILIVIVALLCSVCSLLEELLEDDQGRVANQSGPVDLHQDH